MYVLVVICFKRVEVEDVIEVVEKVKFYLMKEVGVYFIVSVKEVLDVLYGYVDKEREFFNERSRELLWSIEFFIYGRIFLYELIEKVIKLFEDIVFKFFIYKKLLFILLDGEFIDGENMDCVGINCVVVKLIVVDVIVVSCFISEFI